MRLARAKMWLFLRRNDAMRYWRFIVHGLRHRRREFTYAGTTYRYHAAPYNETWANERTVEIPIVVHELRRRAGGRVLEVGNVLANYVNIPHEVVDKYESSPGVLNADVLDFEPRQRYDLIATISTLEHMGLDEDIKEPGKPARAVARLTSLLAPGGHLIATIPLGYNHHLDAELKERGLGFDQVRYLKRISRYEWREVQAAEVAEARYGTPFPKANVVAIGTTSLATGPD